MPYVRDHIKGNGTLGVPVVLYGNRNYDDALMELRNTLEAGGFHTVAGGAFSCQHAFSLTQAAGRPDRSDLTIASGFADQIFRKVEALTSLESLSPVAVKGNDPVGPYYTPRDRHGNPINILPVKPKTTDACTQCGLCARECPLGAIDPEDASVPNRPSILMTPIISITKQSWRTCIPGRGKSLSCFCNSIYGLPRFHLLTIQRKQIQKAPVR